MNETVWNGIALAVFGALIILANRVIGGAARIVFGDKWLERSGEPRPGSGNYITGILVGSVVLAAAYVTILYGIFGK